MMNVLATQQDQTFRITVTGRKLTELIDQRLARLRVAQEERLPRLAEAERKLQEELAAETELLKAQQRVERRRAGVPMTQMGIGSVGVGDIAPIGPMTAHDVERHRRALDALSVAIEETTWLRSTLEPAETYTLTGVDLSMTFGFGGRNAIDVAGLY